MSINKYREHKDREHKYRERKYRKHKMLKKIGLGLFLIVVLVVAAKANESLDSRLVSVLKNCSSTLNSNYYSCFRRNILPIVNRFGVNGVVNSMNTVFEDGEFSSQTFSCHDLSHIVGEVAITVGKSMGPTLVGCTKSCEYGCAHGALIAGISKNPDLLNNLSSVCEPFNNNSYNPQDLNACQHGLGHAVSEFAGLDLEKSLVLCDRINNAVGKNKCAEGVFMQTIDYPDEPTFKISGTILNFCMHLPVNFQAVCFETASLHEHGRSNDDVSSIKTCDQVPTKYHSSCVINLMNLLYSNYQASSGRLLDFCNKYSMGDYKSCLMGIVQSDVLADSSAVVSRAVCQDVREGYKDDCFQMLGSRYEYVYGQSKRSDFCGSLSGDQINPCLSNEN